MIKKMFLFISNRRTQYILKNLAQFGFVWVSPQEDLHSCHIVLEIEEKYFIIFYKSNKIASMLYQEIDSLSSVYFL
jgi:hypothetical protein